MTPSRDSAPAGATPLRGGDRLRRAPNAVGEPGSGEYILLNLDTGAYFGLTPVAELIWHRLDGETTLAVIAEEVTRRWRVDPTVAARDLYELVERLLDRGLVRRVDG